jgi:magnesium transporter
MPMTMLEDASERLRDLLEDPDNQDHPELLRAALRDLHPSDIAFILDDLPHAEALAVFSAMDLDEAAEVLNETSPETNRYLLKHTSDERAGALMDLLPTDDMAEVLSEVSNERREELLEGLSHADREEVRELLSYPERTAGRLMIDTFASVSPSATTAEILAYLRHAGEELETVNHVYVVNGGGRLVGIASLRDVLIAPEDRPIRDFMERNVVTVTPETDQQEAARLIAQYNVLALPVVDAAGGILGIVTVDDIIDVLVEEFNEDYMRMVGSDADEMDRRSSLQVAMVRLPWLLGTMVIELFAGGVISRYDYVLKEVILLASFMPVISAISGNVGLQAAAIVVRGLDTGHVTLRNWWKSVSKELLASLMMAAVCGLVLGGVGAVWSKHTVFGLVIGGAMTASMMTAGFMGTVIPMLSKRFGFDPAATAGPFETAFQDVIGFGVFLWLASLMLPYLK